MHPGKLAPCSNGEFVPGPPPPRLRDVVRRALDDADRNARRLGMSRRSFLRSSMGAATTLLALNACSSDDDDGGSFDVPPEATTDTSAADEALGPGAGEVVIDVQTHFLDPDTGGFGSGFPQAACGDDPELCFTTDRWLDLVLGASDTSAAVLSALPIIAEPAEHPMSTAKMADAVERASEACGDGRVLIQGEAFPVVGSLEAALDRMSEVASAFPLSAWKVYTGIGGRWTLADAVGEAFLSRVSELAAAGVGPAIVAAHKGIGIDSSDVAPAAVAHPDVTFVAYHSGFEHSQGSDSVRAFMASLSEAGIGPGGNVYAELGTTWRSVMTSPTEAAHVIGSLLATLGAERILWGTDSIWYGSPQDQIEAFRAFEISPVLQESEGYPALTPEVKRLILGGNAARLYGIDVAGLEPCRAGRREDAIARTSDRLYGPVTRRQVAATWLAEHPWLAR